MGLGFHERGGESEVDLSGDSQRLGSTSTRWSSGAWPGPPGDGVASFDQPELVLVNRMIRAGAGRVPIGKLTPMCSLMYAGPSTFASWAKP